MTNPNNAIGTNGAYGGRTSVNAFNDNLAIYQGRGVLSGFVVSPDSGMSVVIGGDGTTRDVAIAEDNIGNKTTINNISESPVALTIAGAPASNSRIDAIVAYVDNPAQGSATETDNPSACGLIAVQGTVAATPSQPDENAIRTAITADGASGPTAYYVVLGYITVANGTTDITSEMIAQGPNASLLVGFVGSDAIEDGSITPAKLDSSLSGDTLWTNPNPSQNFAAQTVGFNGSAYDYFVIEFSRLAGNATRQYSCKLKCPDSSSTNISSISLTMTPANLAYTSVRHRTFTITNASCVFNDGAESTISANGTINISTNNSYFVPTRIIGYKD